MSSNSELLDFLVWLQRKHKEGKYPVQTIQVVGEAAVRYWIERDEGDYRLLAWFTRPFDPWLESLNSIKNWDKVRWEGQQERALVWLSQFRNKR